MIYQSKDISVDDNPRTTKLKDDAHAKAEFKKLRQAKSSIRRHRKFVFGAIYKSLFPGYYLIDPSVADFDLSVSVSNNTTSPIKVKMVTPDDGMGRHNLLLAALSLGRSLSGPGNARGPRVGDIGAMHAIGYKSASTRETYKMTDEVGSKVKQLSGLMRNWMEDNLSDVLLRMVNTDKELGVASTLPFMSSGPGSRMMVSVNLGNSPHYDTGDMSESVGLWIEERPNESNNWFFILPNVSHEGSAGVVIKLRHGVVISWDGREIYHCTSKTDLGSNNKTYGCMWGCSRV